MLFNSYFKQFILSFLFAFTISLSFGQTVFTQWTYEPLQGNAANPTPNTGTGSSSTFGAMTGGTTGTGSNDGCSQASGTGAWQIATAAPGSNNESSGVEFLTSTLGYENIVFKCDHRFSNTSSRTTRIQYTLDGNNWINLGIDAQNYSNSCANRGGIDAERIDVSSPVGNNASDSWSRRIIDFTNIEGVNNNPNFGVRIAAAHYSNTGQFRQANNVNSVATGGTWRFDNIIFSGDAIANAPSVSLSVSSNEGNEQNATQITITATAEESVTGNQSVNVVFSGTGITSNDYVLSENTITILDGQTAGQITLTVVDDAVVEGDEAGVIALQNPSSGITLGNQIEASFLIIDNETLILPKVSLSASTYTAYEAESTQLILTATTDSAVSSDQTVNLSITGNDITPSDYFLSNISIKILQGTSTGSVTLIVADDAIYENLEQMTISLYEPSAEIELDENSNLIIDIINNDCSFLTKTVTANSPNGAEISSFEPSSNRLYVVAVNGIDYFTINDEGNLSPGNTLLQGFETPFNKVAIPNSVAIKNNLLAASFAIKDNNTNAQDSGLVAFYQADNGTFINSIRVGYLPDMIIFSPAGNKVLTANEGEPNGYNQQNSFDPEGSVSIIDISNGVESATVVDAGFTSFNGQYANLKMAGIRLFGPNATVAQDLEPEYLAFKNDSIAVVTLQENNSLAFININTATVLELKSLGLKNHNLPGNGFDASDRDSTSSLGKINIQQWPVFGMYMPDAIASYTLNGETYFFTANEGDAREYPGFAEEIRVGAGGYILDNTVFPNAAFLKQNANLGRLQLTGASGDLDNDGDKDQILALGARSFSVWDGNGDLIFDSGDDIEQITVMKNPALFNSEGLSSQFDSRSDNKGPEPEGVVIGSVNGVNYAFIGLERTGDIMVYNITNPAAPQFVQYINTPEDLAVEGLTFVSAENSPTGFALLISTAEVSNTISVYNLGVGSFVYYADSDGDGYGDVNSTPVVSCSDVIPVGFANNNLDCNDDNGNVNPIENEICDGLDNNCDGQIDEFCGCTDALAHNYDQTAVEDDGSCMTCLDGIQNGDETGIDCGGSTCTACQPPVAICGNIVTVEVTNGDLVYNGPGTSDVYLVDAVLLDGGSLSSDESLERQVKRTLTNVAFDWTTNGACVDVVKNNVYNNNDKGLVYRDCLPVSPADFNKIRNFDMVVSDNFGTSICSGRYKVVLDNGAARKAENDEEFFTNTNFNFNIYPNPGATHINVEILNDNIKSKMFDLSILDAVGRKVLSLEKVESNAFNINVAHLASGYYSIVIKSDDTSQIIKWVKL